MKNLLSLILLFGLIGFASGQKIKYNKDVYSLIKDGNYSEALPILRNFLATKENHANGNYWAGKIYSDLAIEKKSALYADSCIFFFNRAIDDITELDVNPLNESKFPDRQGEDVIQKVESLKTYMSKEVDKIESLMAEYQEIERLEKFRRQSYESNLQISKKYFPEIYERYKDLKSDDYFDLTYELKEKNEKAGIEKGMYTEFEFSGLLEDADNVDEFTEMLGIIQERKKWASSYQNELSPLLVVEEYIEAYKIGNIEKMYELSTQKTHHKYDDVVKYFEELKENRDLWFEIYFGFGRTNYEEFRNYSSEEKIEFKKAMISNVNDLFNNLRLTDNDNPNDYSYEDSKPLTSFVYYDPIIVKMYSVLSWNNVDDDNKLHHGDVGLIFLDNKWRIFFIDNF